MMRKGSRCSSFDAGVAAGIPAEETAQLLNGMLNFYGSPEASAGYARFQADWPTHAGTGDCANTFFDADAIDGLWTTEAWNVAAFAYDCVVAFAAASPSMTKDGVGVVSSRLLLRLAKNGSREGEKKGASVRR